jgi:hypothetical protein
MTTTYFISAQGAHNFNRFTSRSQAMAYARRCVADGYEGVTVSRKIAGQSIETIKIYN